MSVAATPHSIDVRSVAMAWVFPGLVITEVVSNQPWWIGQLQPGQLMGWINIAAFAAILFLTPFLSKWARLLIGVIFAAKFGAWLTALPALDTVYRISLAASSAIAGIVLAAERTPQVRRQASVMMLLSAPLMLLQVSGAGAWTQALTTHGITAEGESVSKEGMPTLFVQSHDLNVTNVQMRPAGFLHASEFASLIIIFALVLTLTARGSRRRLVEFAVCVTAVVSMAKIVLMCAAIAIAWVFVTGDHHARRRARDYFVWIALLILAYRVVFPGLFWSNLGIEAFALSLLARAYDVASVLGYGALVDRQLYEVFHKSMNVAEGEVLSGIGQIVRYLPLFVVAAAIATPPLFIAFRRMRRISAVATRMASTMVLSIGLFLVAGPFLASPVFWFCMGFGLLPMLTVLAPNYLQWAISQLETMKRAQRSSFVSRPLTLPADPSPDST